jgi:hypothetical protein
MDFARDIGYRGLFHLKEAARSGTPMGLKEFGPWKTLYEGLSSLPPEVRESWLRFDHFYSDSAFPEALEEVLKHHPRTLLDVGGNTGKFSVLCARRSPETSITILDLPGQLRLAEETLKREGLNGRIALREIDLLDPDSLFPGGVDAVWMSQLLDCFSDEEALSILTRASRALAEGGAVHVMELCWDRQRFEASAFCLQQTSLYFMAIANGTSRFFLSGELIALAERAGLSLADQRDDIGLGHTLFRFVRNKEG